jgi:hypothetical protein
VIGQNPTHFLLDAPKALSDSVPPYESVQNSASLCFDGLAAWRSSGVESLY